MRAKDAIVFGTLVLLFCGGCGITLSFTQKYPLEDALSEEVVKLDACLELGQVRHRYAYSDSDWVGDFRDRYVRNPIAAALRAETEQGKLIACGGNSKKILIDLDILRTELKGKRYLQTCCAVMIPIRMKSEQNVECYFETYTSELDTIKSYHLNFIWNAEGSFHAGLTKTDAYWQSLGDHIGQWIVKMIADDWESYSDYVLSESQ